MPIAEVNKGSNALDKFLATFYAADEKYHHADIEGVFNLVLHQDLYNIAVGVLRSLPNPRLVVHLLTLFCSLISVIQEMFNNRAIKVRFIRSI